MDIKEKIAQIIDDAIVDLAVDFGLRTEYEETIAGRILALLAAETDLPLVNCGDCAPATEAQREYWCRDCRRKDQRDADQIPYAARGAEIEALKAEIDGLKRLMLDIFKDIEERKIIPKSRENILDAIKSKYLAPPKMRNKDETTQ